LVLSIVTVLNMLSTYAFDKGFLRTFNAHLRQMWLSKTNAGPCEWRNDKMTRSILEKVQGQFLGLVVWDILHFISFERRPHRESDSNRSWVGWRKFSAETIKIGYCHWLHEEIPWIQSCSGDLISGFVDFISVKERESLHRCVRG
jgi:hypothetical protein